MRHSLSTSFVRPRDVASPEFDETWGAFKVLAQLCTGMNKQIRFVGWNDTRGMSGRTKFRDTYSKLAAEHSSFLDSLVDHSTCHVSFWLATEMNFLLIFWNLRSIPAPKCFPGTYYNMIHLLFFLNRGAIAGGRSVSNARVLSTGWKRDELNQVSALSEMEKEDPAIWCVTIHPTVTYPETGCNLGQVIVFLLLGTRLLGVGHFIAAHLATPLEFNASLKRVLRICR